MATNKRVFTLRLTDPVFDKIETLSKQQHRSMTNFIEYVMLDYLKEHEDDSLLPINGAADINENF